MRNSIKKSFIFALIVPVAFFTLTASTAPSAKSKTKAYYMGDAASYNGQLIFVSANMGVGAELFTYNNGVINKVNTIRTFDAIYSGFDDFYDVTLKKENGRLYAYAVDGRYLYKYDISNPANPILDTKIKDNIWDYFYGLTKDSEGRLVTVGAKGVRIWNSDLQVIDSFDVMNNHARNISFTSGNDYILNIGEDSIEVFNTKTRKVDSKIHFDGKEISFKQVVFDPSDKTIIIADDSSMKKFDLNGRIIKQKKHISTMAYDVVNASADSNYVYFSDGRGVVKSNRSTLDMVKWRFTCNEDADYGWAMGIKSVSDAGGEKVVVFNNSGILVLDSNLKLLAKYRATEAEDKSYDQLSLNIDKNHAAPNSQVLVSGTGYGLNEELLITFAEKKFFAQSDSNGKFKATITVPDIRPRGGYDIKVTGKTSKLTYSIGFRIE